jgi:hypothetical protein
MSFDDFCVAFRALYVCHYYDPSMWSLTKIQSKWEIASKTASGLPHAHNLTTKASADGGIERVYHNVAENPQWGIVVDRLTDIEIKISQTLNGCAVEHEPHPIAVYLLKSTGTNERVAIKAESLAQKNVVASSGDVARAFEVRLFTEVERGAYTVLAGAYQAGMEGDFEIHITSSHPVLSSQLWPQPWGDGEPPKTISEKIEHGISSAMSKIARTGKTVAMKKLAAKGISTEHIEKLNEALTGESAADKEALNSGAPAATTDDVGTTQSKETAGEPSEEDMAWIRMKQKDADGNDATYYFNKVTNQSVWEVPDGYTRKKAYKKQKKKEKEQAEIDALVAEHNLSQQRV